MITDAESLEPVVLAGHGVRLEPLDTGRHGGGLRAAAQDARIWAYFSTDASGAGFDRWLAVMEEGREDTGDLPFVVIGAQSGEILGSTRFFNLALVHRRLEIGHTWYVPRLWGGRVNPACKLLLMTHAFETLAMNRVEFRTDGRNRRSQAALRRLGAIEEGVLRRHMIVQGGHVRDTVQFAITDEDWPGVEKALEARLGP